MGAGTPSLLAPSLTDTAALGDVAAAEYAHFQLVRDRIRRSGRRPRGGDGPFVEALDAWHAQTQPGDWYEALVKAYVGTGLAGDFYRVAARRVDEET